MKTQNAKGMKRLSAILCMICMMFALCAGTGTAYAQNKAGITVVSCETEKGNIVSVSVKLSNNPGIWGLKFKVGYNHDALTLKGMQVGNVFSAGEVIKPDSFDKEKFVFYASADALENITTNGTLVTLEFQVKDTAAAADYDITLELSQAINIDGEDVAVTLSNGKITVVDCMHDMDWKVTKEASCKEAGTETQFCKKCNKTFESREIQKTKHTSEWKVTKAATCEVNGTETETCKKCGEVLNTREISATGHGKTEVKNAVSATETKEGYTGDKCCVDCGKVLEKGKVIPKVEKETSSQPETPSKPSKPEKEDIETSPDTGENDQTTEEPETEEPTEEMEDTEEVENTEDIGNADDENNAGENPSSPIGAVAAVVVITVAAGGLFFLYRKKMGR